LAQLHKFKRTSKVECVQLQRSTAERLWLASSPFPQPNTPLYGDTIKETDTFNVM